MYRSPTVFSKFINEIFSFVLVCHLAQRDQALIEFEFIALSQNPLYNIDIALPDFLEHVFKLPIEITP